MGWIQNKRKLFSDIEALILFPECSPGQAYFLRTAKKGEENSKRRPTTFYRLLPPPHLPPHPSTANSFYERPLGRLKAGRHFSSPFFFGCKLFAGHLAPFFPPSFFLPINKFVRSLKILTFAIAFVISWKIDCWQIVENHFSRHESSELLELRFLWEAKCCKLCVPDFQRVSVSQYPVLFVSLKTGDADAS